MRFFPSIALTSFLVILALSLTGCGSSADAPSTAREDAIAWIAAMKANDDAEYDRIFTLVEEKMKRLEATPPDRESYKQLLAKTLDENAQYRTAYLNKRFPKRSQTPSE